MSVCVRSLLLLFFFFNDTATTEIYTLSLHDALPISKPSLTAWSITTGATHFCRSSQRIRMAATGKKWVAPVVIDQRSEEHTSELQSQSNLVCRLLLEKKKKKTTINPLQQHTMTEQSD